MVCGFVRARTWCTYPLFQGFSVFFNAEGQSELVGHGYDPIKLHRRTMQKMMAISDVINARELTAFMVEEARASLLLDAAVLLPAILTGGSYVDCVEVVF